MLTTNLHFPTFFSIFFGDTFHTDFWVYFFIIKCKLFELTSHKYPIYPAEIKIKK